MPHFLYILFSASVDRYYVGETPVPDSRILQHNNHFFPKGFTKSANDWSQVLKKECKDKADAMYLERFIKRMKSRKFIEKVIDNPRILQEILDKR